MTTPGAASELPPAPPDRAVELATKLSIAVRIEPELMRAMRLAALPNVDVSAEADLWFSRWVRTRGADGIVLLPAVQANLQQRLADQLAAGEEEDEKERQLVWDVLARVHESISPALQLEERVAWLVARDRLDAAGVVDEALRPALRSLVVEGRTGVADWFARAWQRLPEVARATLTAWQLAQVSANQLPGPRLPVTTVPPGLAATHLTEIVGALKDARLGVRREGTNLELGDISGTGTVAILVPDTDPRLLEVQPIDEADRAPETVAIRPGESRSIQVGVGVVLIRTARGHLYQIAPSTQAETRSQRDAIAFSPDGSQLASAGSDGTVRLWDPATGTERATLTGHTGPVMTVVFSPDGSQLASAGSDGTVRLWDPATGSPATDDDRPSTLPHRDVPEAGPDARLRGRDGEEKARAAGRRRWLVKTGADPDAKKLVGQSPTTTTIASLCALAVPAVLPPEGRSPGAEETVWQLDTTLFAYKRQSNGDYHLVIADDQGNTMIAKIPDPAALAPGSFFAQQIAAARQTFDSHFGIQVAAASTSGPGRATRFIQVAEPVTLQGLGFFDFQRGQTGVAPNAIELHPIISIVFHRQDYQERARAAAEESKRLRQARAIQRWSVRSGADPDAQKLVGQAPTTTTIASLCALAVPAVLPPEGRSPGAEETVWQLDATLTAYNRQLPSGDYHLTIADNQGNTMIAKIPDPAALAPGSFFAQQIAAARQVFDSRFGIQAATYGPADTTPYIQVAEPVTLQGLGFFAFRHGQHGVAPNGIELHPVISIVFRGQAPAAASQRA